MKPKTSTKVPLTPARIAEALGEFATADSIVGVLFKTQSGDALTWFRSSPSGQAARTLLSPTRIRQLVAKKSATERGGLGDIPFTGDYADYAISQQMVVPCKVIAIIQFVN